MDQAAAKTRDFAAGSGRQLAAQRDALLGIGRSALVVGAAVAAGVGIAIAKFAEFDQAMSNVNAVTQETAENLALLREAALDAGGATIFTATEAANAIEELGKAGISTADILDGALNGSLALAASGQLEVARAAEITATTLKQFGLDGNQAGHVADVLSAAAGKALGSVEDLAQGLKFVGPVAASMGVSLEETAGALALFADQGLIGEQAGTSLRGVLSSLTSPSSQAAAKIQELGITLYDSNGQFLGLENTAGQLADAFRGVDDKSRDMSLGIIFGNQQVTAARVLFEQGGEAVARYTAEVNDAGYAARVAADRMDNLQGDIEKLSGAIDTALIRSGSGANDILRGLTQSATFLVDAFGELPAPVLAVGLAVGVATASVLLLGGAALVTIPRLAQLRAVMATSGITAGSLAAKVGIASAALTAATLVIGFFVARQAEAAATTKELRDSLDQASGAITGYTRDLVSKKLAESGAFEAAKEAGVSQRELTDAVLEGGEALDEIRSKLTSNNTIGTFFTGVGIRAGNASQSIDDLRGSVVQSKNDFDDLEASGTGASNSLGDMSAAALDSTGNIEALSEAIAEFNEQQFRADNAVFNFKQSLLDLNEAMGAEGFTGTLDLNTQEGIDNQRMLRDLAGDANAAASEILTLTGDQEAANAVLQEARDRLSEVGAQFGLSGDALQAFIDTYVTSPHDLAYQMTINVSPALQALETLRAKLANNQIALDSLNNWRPSTFSYLPSSRRGSSGGFALGGYTGVGGKYQAAGVVHAGEFVSTQETLAHPSNRAALEFMQAGGVMKGYAMGGYVTPRDSGWSGAITAFVDPALQRAIERLASSYRATLDTVGLADATAAGAARSAALGSR